MVQIYLKIEQFNPHVDNKSHVWIHKSMNNDS